jgi:hypothetical protein
MPYPWGAHCKILLAGRPSTSDQPWQIFVMSFLLETFSLFCTPVAFIRYGYVGANRVKDLGMMLRMGSPVTLNRDNSSRPNIQIFLTHIYASQNLSVLYLFRRFLNKKVVFPNCISSNFFKSKRKRNCLLVVAFLCIPGG